MGRDVTSSLSGQRFIWDEDKALANITKHRGVTFEEAREVFLDPLSQYVGADTPEEERSACIGQTTRRRVLYAVHVTREGDTIRIISARPATREERRFYEDYE